METEFKADQLVLFHFELSQFEGGGWSIIVLKQDVMSNSVVVVAVTIAAAAQ